ncbi:hypothetical protein JSQ81_17485 [Sporosarcina sp. Marseille-Q4063]|uniref:hypothetical protein n=1 Tax=Sporosarcina sp. Marseille-Q4063 TaxID=2810514 RepID=UPI001BB0293C|nr:hypothetical protein [Sporosarcina sp. Marseille-Q4063]QUW21565.1 hypothetical protein JSQ81_17485 [Sporosarcina sp. Marseille-Q4063]
MTRSVEVYLKSENDAESVRASLQTAKVKNLVIDEMGEEESNTRMFTPFFPTNIGGSGMPGSVGPIGANAPIVVDEDVFQGEDANPTHLLKLEVEESEYDHVLSILQNHECYTSVQ